MGAVLALTLAALNRLIDQSTATASSRDPYDTHLLALAAILLFCIFDIRQGNSTNWFWHITAAKNLISCRTNSTTHLGPSSDPWPFLLDLFEYVDSIITISKCKPPLMEHDKHGRAAGAQMPGAQLNPIFGLSRPLIRYIGQISALSNRRKYRVNARFEQKFRESAAVIAGDLGAWEDPVSSSTSTGTGSIPFAAAVRTVRDADRSAAVHCAHAIKHASVLRLHQVVDGYRIPSGASTRCLRAILDRVRRVPIGSPAESALVFPLFMAGAVSTEREDRMTVACRWDVIGRTIGFGNVAIKGRAVLDLVWARMDEDFERARGRGEPETSEVNWASIRWHSFSELVLF
ncbi:fungal-specific transcription factor domain-containing protein [Xylariaceae sp. FL0804]|nr:fungal-specific transcription factor domain-containing protein [Xylariaceae sp. FL0804]